MMLRAALPRCSRAANHPSESTGAAKACHIPVREALAWRGKLPSTLPFDPNKDTKTEIDNDSTGAGTGTGTDTTSTDDPDSVYRHLLNDHSWTGANDHPGTAAGA